MDNRVRIATSADNLPRAIAAIVFAVLALSLGDAVIKAISVSFPLWQLYVLRSAIVLPILCVLISRRQPDIKLLPDSIGWVSVRSLLLALMWIAYYSALPHLQLSVAAAGYYTLPLFITLFSGIFIGERVGVIGWLAIGLGFAGVLVMLRPDTESFNIFVLFPLLAAILYALAMILTRTKCRKESPLVLSAALNAMFIVIGGIASIGLAVAGLSTAAISKNVFLLGGWVGLGAKELIALAVLAAAILIGSIGAAIAYQSASSSTVATFDYSYLAFSVMWGAVFFT
ncbi:MAG TPA: DMT family transporter, partial [Hyphomicrobiales bacterium]|nr:DMT family transporter [Hyphomicrobiales bacterium]